MSGSPSEGPPGARDRLVEAARLVGVARLLPTVAHQLSTPLASIALRAESLERAVRRLGEGAEVETLVRHLRAIQEETFRCKELLGTLQDFARGPVAPVPVDVSALVRGAVRLVQHAALRRQVEVEVRAADLLPPVTGDEVRLGQCVLSLVHNAVLASPQSKRVVVEARAEDGVLLVTVSDEGEGIPEEIQRGLFEPFVSGRPVEEGVGLSLMACSAIATAHGGSVRWETTPGRGSRLTLALPRKAAAPPADAAV